MVEFTDAEMERLAKQYGKGRSVSRFYLTGWTNLHRGQVGNNLRITFRGQTFFESIGTGSDWYARRVTRGAGYLAFLGATVETLVRGEWEPRRIIMAKDGSFYTRTVPQAPSAPASSPGTAGD